MALRTTKQSEVAADAAIRQLLYKLGRFDGLDTRDILCTPSLSAYGRAGELTLAVVGTPARGLFVCDLHYTPRQVVFVHTGTWRAKRLGERQAAIVHRYVRECVLPAAGGKTVDALTEPVTVPPLIPKGGVPR